MLKLVAFRLASAIPVIGIVAVLVFVFLRLTGDPAAGLLGEDATTKQVEELRRSMGLDRPLVEQFFIWFGNVLRGDFGRSLVTGQPVSLLIGQRLEATLSLALTTTVLSVLVAVPLGLAAARYRGSWLDRAIMLLCVSGFSTPTFVVGYLLVWIFSVHLGLLPAQGYATLASGFWPWLTHLVAPTIAMATVFVVLIARITRASVIETLEQDYIRTARAMGANERRVFVLFALRNAAVPIVTIVGVGLGIVLTGVVVTETVFNLPGIGRLTIEAIVSRDFPVIQASIILFSFAYLLINLSIDILYTLLDPRIRY